MKIGFIGVGKMGREHARAAAYLGHEVWAGTASSCYSQSWGVFKESYPNAKFLSVFEMLADPNVEQIVISLPPKELEKFRLDIMFSDKPILVEKPFGISNYNTLIRDKSATVTENISIAMNRRFYEPVIRMKCGLVLNKPKSVEINISESVTEKMKRLKGSIKVRDLPLYSYIHVLDLAMFILDSKFTTTHIVGYMQNSGFRSITAMCACNLGTVPVVININEDDPINTGIIVRTENGMRYSLSPLEKLTIYNGLTVSEDTSGNRIYTPTVQAVIEASKEFKPGILEQMRMFTEDRISPYLGNIEQENFIRNFIHELNDESIP